MKKVALCGGANTYKEAPFNDDSFEIWGQNDLYEVLPRCSRLFQIHDIEQIKNTITRYKFKNHFKDLTTMNIPVYMQEKHDEIKASVKYPLQQMIEEFDDYFTNSISYMCALAIYEGFEEIHFYGINMSHATEYGAQKSSVEYFIGIMKGRGIKYFIHPKSDLLKTYYRYGYEQKKCDNFTIKCKERMNFLNTQKKQTQKQIEDLQKKLNRNEGALEDLRHTLMIYN